MHTASLTDGGIGRYGIRWVLILIKLITSAMLLGTNLFVRNALCPLIPFPQMKRYICSIANLFCMRVTLAVMGFIDIESNNFRFFNKHTPKITLKSGFVGVGTHKSVVDYLYYSYLFNPVFVRLIIHSKGETSNSTIYYAPLSFWESITAALDLRGFDPIVVHSEKELKRIKLRKMALKTLISECFQEINGPIFIMLPGVKPGEQVSLPMQLAADAFENEQKFCRSLVGFCLKPDPRIEQSQLFCSNQFYALCHLMSHLLCWYRLTIYSNAFRNTSRGRYDFTTYATFIDKFYQECGEKVNSQSYQQYLTEMDEVSCGVRQFKQE